MELLKFIKSLLKKGFATKSEKADLAKRFKQLDEEDQENVAEEVAAVEALPEEPKDESLEETKTLLKSLMGEMKMETIDEVKAEFKSWLDSQKDLMSKKAGVYANEAKSERKAINTYFKSFCSALYQGNDVMLKELTTADGSSPYGGYVVSAELSAEIRHLITEHGVARREMMNVQLAKNSYKANNLVTDVSVVWVDEAAAIASKQVVLGQVELELKKLGAIVTLTSELIEDEEVDLFSFVGSRIAEKLAEAEDLAFFKGDGTATYGSFTGLLRNTNINSVTMASTKTTFASVTTDDLIDMQDATPAGALGNAKYYMHRSIMSVIRKLKATTNEYIYTPISAQGPASLAGYPVVLVEAMPAKSATAVSTAFILFGDLKKACILGYKGAIKAKRFDAGVVRNVADNADINLISTDREAIRWTERVGYIVILPSAVTRLITAAS